MIIFNEKEYQGKYALYDNMLLVINSNLTLNEIYEKLRKGEDISPDEVQIHGYMNGNGKIQLEGSADTPAEVETPGLERAERAYGGVTAVASIPIGKEAFLSQDDIDDLSSYDQSKVYKRDRFFDAYEKMHFGKKIEGYEIKHFPFNYENPQHKEILRRHIAIACGSLPTLFGDTSLSLEEIKKMSIDGAHLYRDYGKGSATKDNPIPTKEEIEKYQALSEYEKRLVNSKFVHPAKVMELKEKLGGTPFLTNDLYRKLIFFEGDVEKTASVRTASVTSDLRERFAAEFTKQWRQPPRVLDEFIQGCIDLYKLDKMNISDEKIEELVKGFDRTRFQTPIIKNGNKQITVAMAKNPCMLALSRELKLDDFSQKILQAMTVYIDQNNAHELYEKGIVEWLKANKNVKPAEFIEMIESADIIKKFDPRKSASELTKSLDTELGMRDAKLFEQKYHYRFADNEIAIKGRHLVVEDGPYKMYMLSADDPRNFVSGYDTKCCQRWDDGNYTAGGKQYKMQVLKNPPTRDHNAGGSCVYKLTSDPFAANVVIEKGGEIVGQSFVWVDALTDTFVFDNIEYANDGRAIQYCNIIGLYAKHLPYANVQLGMGCNGNQKLNGVGEQVKNLVKMPTTIDSSNHIYSDYHSSARDLKRLDPRTGEGKMVRYPLNESRCRITTAPDEPTRWDPLTEKGFAFLLNDCNTPVERRLAMVEEFKDNPSEALQVQVVSRDPRAVLALENPSTSVQMMVFEKAPDIAAQIEHPCEELQIALLDRDPNYLRKNTNVPENLLVGVLQKNGLLLSILHEESKTIPVCEAALGQSGYAWGAVPYERKSESLALVAVNTDPKVVSLIEPEFCTPEVQLAAARKDPSVVLLMDCTVQSQMAAISRKPDLVLQLKEPALPVVRVAIQRNPGLIRKYQYEFPSLRMEAISRNGFVAKDLSNLTVEEYNAAIAQNDKVARFVKNPATRQENFQARSTVTHHVQLSANDDFLESIEIG